MPFWRRDDDDEGARRTEAEAEAQRSRQALEAGGIPIRAMERAERIRGGGAVGPFSSTLSVNELSFLRQAGYAPLGLVAGSSVYHIRWNAWNQTGELDNQTGALQAAAGLAIGRLRQEAHGMGALGVIGVRLRIQRPAWGEHLLEVTALGTAVQVPAAPTHAEPFTSGLSGQEFCALLRAGCRPLGLVFGNSSYYIYATYSQARQMRSWANQELDVHTQALRYTQRASFARMHAAAAHLGAQGVVGVRIERSIRRIEVERNDQSREDFVIEHLNWGTAIAEAPADIRIARPSMLIDLEDLPPRPRARP